LYNNNEVEEREDVAEEERDKTGARIATSEGGGIEKISRRRIAGSNR
jgi:hypothetical protein